MERRNFIKSCACTLALGATAGFDSDAEAASKPANMRPQKGDVLVVEDGSGNARAIKASELALEAQPIMAFPQDPTTGVIRSGSRWNKIMVIRLDSRLMDEKTTENSADGGIVAYSAICTHEGCDVNSYIEDKKEFFCFCHYSRFNPYAFGEVANGPATRRLGMLPIKIEDDLIIASGGFTQKPGFKR